MRLAVCALLTACASRPPPPPEASSVPLESAVPLPAVMPARYLRSLEYDPRGYGAERATASDLLLGDLLFHSPLTLGQKAQSLGLSCQSCHPNGATHAGFTLAGVSTRPGSADLSTGFFRTEADDGVQNALDIPSLRGCRFTGPYGRDGRTASLAEFASSVVHSEFDGPPLEPNELAALVRYLQELDFLPNPNLGAHNELSANASDAARRGQALFELPRTSFAGKSCASCHPSSSFFRDGQVHRIGSGSPPSPNALDGGYETPSLLGLAESAPYFHDGRFATLNQVVRWFDNTFSLGLSSQEQDDLTAYVEAVGAIERPSDDRPLALKLDHVFAYVSLLPTKNPRVARAVGQAVHDALQRAPAAFAARAEAAARALDRLQDSRENPRALREDLSRLAADWAGSANERGQSPTQK